MLCRHNLDQLLTSEGPEFHPKDLGLNPESFYSYERSPLLCPNDLCQLVTNSNRSTIFSASIYIITVELQEILRLSNGSYLNQKSSYYHTSSGICCDHSSY